LRTADGIVEFSIYTPCVVVVIVTVVVIFIVIVVVVVSGIFSARNQARHHKDLWSLGS
jgi:hypothetical protein